MGWGQSPLLPGGGAATDRGQQGLSLSRGESPTSRLCGPPLPRAGCSWALVG